MNREQAKRLIIETFENPFNKDKFTKFIKNLLKQIEEKPLSPYGPLSGSYIPEAYREYISSYERIGKYFCGDQEIDILIVTLQRESSLERARTAQRNFIAWYLNGGRGGILRDAALVAFLSPTLEDWRFSLVKMYYRFDEKGRVKSEFTPARRWSYLVGKNEKSHTAQSRFIRFLEDDEHKPTLEELEEAFSVEKVTDEFFIKYRELLIRTKQALDDVIKHDERVRAEFTEKNIDPVNFAKKLLGQIVFLYFLQKKGWLGVHRDADWGTGSKHFLRELFEKKHGDYENFFNDILEPLFYEALRSDRSHDDHFYSRFNCKIPFLNSELFDPINDYDWVHIDILLPNELFSNSNKTEEGDIGDGILDIFDRYNFTVKEDEPLEKEVAIDPELLGKAYEKFNAIRQDNFDEYVKIIRMGKKGEETKFNKEHGVYYTPREIVHYMCQESLIYYLANLLKGRVDEEEIRQFVFYAEQFSDYERVAEEKEGKIRKGDLKQTKYNHRLPESIRQNAEFIDKTLADIRICDPAVGSGAFPVGMMQEIVRLRTALNPFVKSDANRTPYRFKRECIENSLFGVDIDPGAVEIAKLRMWLSLIVDEEDIHYIKPLPNLGYKVVPGNSLLGLPNQWYIYWKTSTATKIAKIQKEYVSETHPTRKKELKNEFDQMIGKWLEYWEASTGYEVNFDFPLFFPEVFLNKGGFDIVIANPPYVRQERIKEIKPELETAFPRFYNSTADLYTFFYKKAYDILRENGILCFISSNKWMRAKYGGNLRQLLKLNTRLREIIDFGGFPVFEQTVDTAIVIFEKGEPDETHKFKFVNVPQKVEDLIKFIRSNYQFLEQKKLGTDVWSLAEDKVLMLKEKLERIGKPLKYWDIKILFGIKTGFNEAFIVDEKRRKEILNDCQTDEERRRTEEIIKPVLRGRDIFRYHYKWAGKFIICTFPALKLNINNYPALKRYLSQWKNRLPQDGKPGHRKKTCNKWFETQDNIAYFAEFGKEKIVWQRVTRSPKFALVPGGYYCEATTHFIIGDNLRYMLGVFNSKLFHFAFYEFYMGGGIEGEIKGEFIGRFPLPSLTSGNADLVKHIETLVAQILSFTQSADYEVNIKKQNRVKELEREIDELVYRLYDLTEEEIKIIENAVLPNK